MENLLVVVYLIIMGASLGSFALLLSDRIKKNKDWVRGRSKCDNCDSTLGVVDLIPILSYIYTKGKCRYCKAKLSVGYPLAEVFTAICLVLSFTFFPVSFGGFSGKFLFGIWTISLVIMTALLAYDIRWYKLPNKLVYPLIILASLYRLILTFSNNVFNITSLLNLTGSLLVGAGLFALIFIFSSGKWIGDGDIRLGVALGLFLPGPIEAWLAIFVASTVGLVLGAPSLLKSKKKISQIKLPFGPALIIGLIVSFLFARNIIDWYTATFLFIN